MRPLHVLPLQVRVNLEVMATRGYFTHPKAPELESHHQIQFIFIPRTLILFDPSVKPLQVKVDLGVIEGLLQMQFCVI